MSFDLVCESCGAPSGHSVGICPFCKNPLSHAKNECSATLEALSETYRSGNSDLAVIQVNKLLEDRAAVIKNLDLLLLCVKVLIEVEAPKSRLNALLAEALLEHPQNKELKTYYVICEARYKQKFGYDDQFEHIMLQALKSDPNNVHANFVWGTYLFWNKERAHEALKYLECCVRTHPNFKRAWGCLGAIYSKIGNQALSHKAYDRFQELETNSVVREMIHKIAA